MIREFGVGESNRRYLLERTLLAGGSDAEGQLLGAADHGDEAPGQIQCKQLVGRMQIGGQVSAITQ